MNVALVTAVLLGTGTGMAAQSKKDMKPQEETVSDPNKKRISKIEKKKLMHEERKAAAARFKASREAAAKKK